MKIDREKLSKAETLQVLYYYKDKINKEIYQPGWSPWAIMGAFVGLVWLLINTVNEPNIDWDLSLKLAFVTTIDISMLLYYKFSQHNTDVYLFSFDKTQSMANIQADIYLFIIASLGLVAVIQFFDVHFLQKVLFIYCIGIMMVLQLYKLAIVIKSKYPLKDIIGARLKKHGTIINVSFIFCVVCFNIILIGSFFPYSMNINTLKLGLVLTGLHFTFYIFLSFKKFKPSVNLIDDLIDDLTFGEIDSKRVLDNLKLIVYGATFKTFVANDLKLFINSSIKYHSSIEVFNSSFDDWMDAKSNNSITEREFHEASEKLLGNFRNTSTLAKEALSFGGILITYLEDLPKYVITEEEFMTLLKLLRKESDEMRSKNDLIVKKIDLIR